MSEPFTPYVAWSPTPQPSARPVAADPGAVALPCEPMCGEPKLERRDTIAAMAVNSSENGRQPAFGGKVPQAPATAVESAHFETPRRPVLRYHGGKWKLAPWIIQHFPSHRVYVEPYAGAASVLLRKPRAYAEVINDLDGEVVNVFRVLRDPERAADLERRLRLTPYAREEFTDCRNRLQEDLVEWARQSVTRSFMGFGADGLVATWDTGFRGDTKRDGGTPARDWVNYPDVIEAFTQRLTGVVIESRPAADVIHQHDAPETLIYCDPPYPHGTRKQRDKHAYRHEMTDDEHRALAAALHSVAGMVVLSGYPCDLYDLELFAGWHRIERAAHADGARDRTEVLWLNAAASAALQRSRTQLDLFAAAAPHEEPRNE